MVGTSQCEKSPKPPAVPLLPERHAGPVLVVLVEDQVASSSELDSRNTLPVMEDVGQCSASIYIPLFPCTLW